MLRPIKNFISYLQKNANGATIFGVSSNMSAHDLETDTETVENDTKDVISCQNKREVMEDDLLIRIDDNDEMPIQRDIIEILSKPIEKLKGESNSFTTEYNKVVSETCIVSDLGESDNLNLMIHHEKSLDAINIEEYQSDILELEDIAKENDYCLDTPEKDPKSLIIDISECSLEFDQRGNYAEPSADPLALDNSNAEIDGHLCKADSSFALGESTLNTSTQDEGMIFIIDVDDIKNDSRGIVKTKAKNLTTGDNFEPQIIISDNEKEECYTTPTLRVEEIIEEQEVRSDGSDSGLGSETLALQTTVSSIDSASTLDISRSISKLSPIRGNLKRRSDDSNLLNERCKKPKKSIQFDSVTVFYFPRMQGFACVPSQGGCTLGMGSRHINTRQFTLAEHAAEQRRVHRQQMQEVNPRTSSSDDSDTEEEISEASGSDLDTDASGFLQPVTTRQRRAILKAAGIRKIDPIEKDDCRAIRGSREFCGCSCRGYCDPDTCSCSQSGIKCQVDRPNYPCGCTRDGCANVIGRIEFNPSRVRTHFIHTIMRLDLENKTKRTDELDNSESSTMLLGYTNSFGTSSSIVNSSLTSSLNNCSNSITNNLSNICNYSIPLRQQAGYGPIILQHLHHQQQPQHHQQHLQNVSYASTVTDHNNMYMNGLQGPTMVLSMNIDGHDIQNSLHNSHMMQHPHLHQELPHQLASINPNSSLIHNNSSNSHNVSNDVIVKENHVHQNNSIEQQQLQQPQIQVQMQPHTNLNDSNHPHHMHYAFRDINQERCDSAINVNVRQNNNFQSSNNHLYHETYNGTYLESSYSNPNLQPNNCTSTNNEVTIINDDSGVIDESGENAVICENIERNDANVRKYMSYQQSYINYTSSMAVSEAISLSSLSSRSLLKIDTVSNEPNIVNNSLDIIDMNDDTSTNYISLHPPVGNSQHLQDINNLLQSNRNVEPITTSHIQNHIKVVSSVQKSTNSDDDLTAITLKKKPLKHPLALRMENSVRIDSEINDSKKDCEESKSRTDDHVEKEFRSKNSETDTKKKKNYQSIEESSLPSDINSNDVNIDKVPNMLSVESVIDAVDLCDSGTSLSSVEWNALHLTTESMDEHVEKSSSPINLCSPVISIHDDEENIGDIIKKSIVEIVSS